jgi:hypothetical protein
MPRRICRIGLFAVLAALGPTRAGDRLGPADGPLRAAAASLGLVSRGDAEALLLALRGAGPEGLQAALDQRDRLIAAGRRDVTALDAVLDRLAGQLGAAESRLYWYTDLDQALAVAAREDKPVLSLRLLGRLDESLSCANSRMFRALLYPDPQVGALLRERFVLHWETFREAPVIRIDFGDGRVLERTITGNSIHYVLAPDGHLLDAIPGLNTPSVFIANLETAAARMNLSRDDLRQTWRDEVVQLGAEHAVAVRSAGLPAESAADWQPVDFDADGTTPARTAAPLAISKRAIERPLLGGLDARAAEADAAVADWMAIGNHYRHPQLLSAAAIEAIAAQQEQTGEALAQTIAKLEATLLADTAQNQLSLRRNLLIWLADGEGELGLQTFNDHVYTALFRTPASDPWLGLAPTDVFAAVDGGGLRLPQG